MQFNYLGLWSHHKCPVVSCFALLWLSSYSPLPSLNLQLLIWTCLYCTQVNPGSRIFCIPVPYSLDCEHRTGMQWTLVNIVRGLTYIPGYKVSPDVRPKGIRYSASAEVNAIRREDYPANRQKTPPVRSLAIMLGAIKSVHCLSRGGQHACVFSTVVEFEEDWT